MKTIQKVSEETLVIENFLSDRKPGEFLTYKEIQEATKVEMNVKGKAYMRTALKRLKFEYAVVKGKGIELACSENTMTIMTSKLVKIDNAVKRGEKTFNNLIPFHTELDSEDQKKLNFVGAAFGAIRLAAENGKRMLTRTKSIKPNDSETININN